MTNIYTKPENALQNIKNTFMHQTTETMNTLKIKYTKWNIKRNIIDAGARADTTKKSDICKKYIQRQLYIWRINLQWEKEERY